MDNFWIRLLLCGITAVVSISIVKEQAGWLDRVIDKNTRTLELVVENYDYWDQVKLPEGIADRAKIQADKFDNQVEKIANGEIVEGLSGLVNDEFDYYASDSHKKDVRHNANTLLSVRVWLLDCFAKSSLVTVSARSAVSVLTFWSLTSSLLILFIRPQSSDSLIFGAMVLAAFAISIVIGGAVGLVVGSQWGALAQIGIAILSWVALIFCILIQIGIQGGIPIELESDSQNEPQETASNADTFEE